MSLNKLIFGSYKCHQDHEHRTEVDMKECNDLEQKRREMEYKLEAQKLEDQREKERHKEKMEALQLNIELERMKEQNIRNEQKVQKSKICSIS